MTEMTSGPDEPLDDLPGSAAETSVGSTGLLLDDDRIRASRDEDLDGFDEEDVVRVRAYDPLTIAMAGSFGAFIPGVVEAANATLVRTTELHGEFSISNGGGTMEDYFREAFDMPDDRGKSEDDDNDSWQDYAEAHEERRREREEREREEWAQTEHSLAGVEMTGEEWEQLANDIGPNGRLRQKLVQWYMKNGKTQADAEKKATEAEEIYHIQAKPETQRTPEEQKKLDKANSDPDFRAATSFLNNQRMEGVTPVNALELTSNRASQDVSISTRADAFDSDKPSETNLTQPAVAAASSRSSAVIDFPSAPDLTEHHQAAMAATVPLDAPKAPTPVAAAAPAPGSGFDV